MKKLMDGYIGVKFRASQISADVPFIFKYLFPLFKHSAELLKEYGMAPENGGNMSLKKGDGILITSSGSNLGLLNENEIVYVKKCSTEDQTVEFKGYKVPSSETFMHYLIYQSRHDINAIIHAHDPATSGITVDTVRETIREEPYGTLALAKIACDTFSRNENIIVLKNHGYVGIGQSLQEVTRLIISTHLKLLKEIDKFQ